jgi:hypothetical protein
MLEALKVIVALIAIPFLLTVYAARWDKIPGTIWDKAFKKNYLLALSLLVLTGVAWFLEWRDYTHKDPSSLDVELELLDVPTYRIEVDAFAKADGHTSLEPV